MGYNKQATVNDYWQIETTEDGITGNNFFPKIMGRDFWRAIDRCFQAKLPWIQKNFFETSVTNWNLKEKVCIDESLVR